MKPGKQLGSNAIHCGDAFQLTPVNFHLVVTLCKVGLLARGVEEVIDVIFLRFLNSVWFLRVVTHDVASVVVLANGSTAVQAGATLLTKVKKLRAETFLLVNLAGAVVVIKQLA